jgi:glycosyltransferase involved in cell wall biosynthesis
VKIAYVVYNERPSSGLMRTQVIALLKEIRKRAPDIEIDLLAIWQPWVMRGFGAEIRAMRTELAAAGIRQIDLPWALIPTRHFAYRAPLFPLLRLWLRLLMRLALRRRYDVVHCRGYLPSYGAALARGALGHRLVFDMRSLWPKEHVTIGAWRTEDAINRQWERLETFTVAAADASIGVSPAMVDEIRKISPLGHAVHVPICVDLGEMNFDAAARTARRAELGWQTNPVIAYQGSLGLLNSNLVEVAEYLKLVRAALPSARFIVLTANVGADVDGVMERFGISRQEYAVRHPARHELAGWLSAADAGIHAMSAGPDSATRLGVKIVEYLSCALPIVVNPHVGAAAELVREHGVGVVIDSPDVATVRAQIAELLATHPVPSQRARQLAAGTFSLQACADRYIALYRGAPATGAETRDAV